ncbi:MAG: hypothetical protein A2Y12_12645 [Planctomycetes bacterium GWF2_42_9]|nr:MAG: hypothetical protein A2Y12_12645 [Planctomycetes bacterium GWF2_42_9]
MIFYSPSKIAPSLLFCKQAFFKISAIALSQKSRKTRKKPEFFRFFYEKVSKNTEKVPILPPFFDLLAQNYKSIAHFFL